MFRDCFSLLTLPYALMTFIELDLESIEVIMREGGCSRQVAITTLIKNDGDPIEALLDLHNKI